MEWDLKMPPWDLSELGQNAGEANLSSVIGSSGSSPRRQPGGIDCSVDLKLGGLGEFGLADKWKEESRASTMVPQSPAVVVASSLKRPRATSGGNQVSCLVDGCKNDLSNCREYHRRHKVCEVHSKTPIVLVGGLEQRFCQQCSRFHLLVEFDEVKRSCRKRLDGHNRRRRKPQPDCINSGNLFPNQHEIRFTSYPQMFPTAAAADTSWSPIIKSEEDALYNQHNPSSMHFINRTREQEQPPQHFGCSFNHSFKEGKQFSFFHDSDDTALGNRTTKTISSAAESSGNKIIFSDGLPPVLDSDCALSLLSSSNQTSGISIGHMVPVDRIPMGQPLPSRLQYSSSLDQYTRSQAASENVSPTGFSCSGVENEHLSTVLVSDSSEAGGHCQNIFDVGDEGASDGAANSLHFSW